MGKKCATVVTAIALLQYAKRKKKFYGIFYFHNIYRPQFNGLNTSLG
jgi:hypothetical protein